MEQSIPLHYVEAYGRNLRMAPQEGASILLPHVESDLAFTEKGDKFSDYSLGARKMKEVSDRFGNTPNFIGQRKKRTQYFSVHEDGELFDNVDQVHALHDPMNPTVVSMRNALARERDLKIFEGMLGSVWEGRNGTTKKNFPTSQRIAVNNRKYFDGLADDKAAPTATTPLPLTVAKLRVASVMLKKSKIPGQAKIAAPSEQIVAMLTSMPVTHQDYNSVRALVNGEINTFLGFEFLKEWEDGDLVDENTQHVVAWKGAAVCYKSRDLKKLQISPRADKRYAYQSYFELEHGCMRKEDEGVVDIHCALPETL